MLDWATDKDRGEEGEWMGEEGVKKSLFKRMERLLDQELGVEMASLLKQGIVMQEKDEEGNVKPDEKEREKTRLCKMKMIVKVHKDGRASEMGDLLRSVACACLFPRGERLP